MLNLATVPWSIEQKDFSRLDDHWWAKQREVVHSLSVSSLVQSLDSLVSVPGYSLHSVLSQVVISVTDLFACTSRSLKSLTHQSIMEQKAIDMVREKPTFTGLVVLPYTRYEASRVVNEAPRTSMRTAIQRLRL
jgi:hypothetical protein